MYPGQEDAGRLSSLVFPRIKLRYICRCRAGQKISKIVRKILCVHGWLYNMLLVCLVNVNVSLNVGRECCTSNKNLFLAPATKHRIGCRLFSLTVHRTDRSEEGGSCSTSSQLSEISVGDFIRAVRIHGRARPPTALFGPIPILAIVFSQRIYVRKNVYLVLHFSPAAKHRERFCGRRRTTVCCGVDFLFYCRR